MRSVIVHATTLLLMFGLGLPSQVDATDANDSPTTRHPFFAFCFDTHDARQRDFAAQAEMLRELGFDGAGHVGLERLSERLETLDRVGLRLFMAGIVVDLSQPRTEPLSALRETLPQLRGREVVLYVVLTGYPSEDPRGDEPGVAVLREIADLVRGTGVKVGLYPHTGDWVSRVDHAVRVVNEVDQDHCGVIFNLCHWLRNEELDELDQVLDAARPHLLAVTINGADLAGKNDADWQRLIQPLDRGDFDLRGFLEKLRAREYAGPIGLMCWGITGDAEPHLRRSITQWRALSAP
jgi:sugar phosphate isomerase/epimerase